MGNKKAFVFDTNFIIEHIHLDEVVKAIGNDYALYVTQVSIDERISQKYLELKKKYDAISKFENDYRGMVNIKTLATFESRFEKEKARTQKGYKELFENRIIPFQTSDAMFSRMLDRVYRKLPPFLSVDGSSDKGFKDSLLWVSLLDFFAAGGEDEVVFITNDNGFRKQILQLCEEFLSVTGKLIEIKDSSYYKELTEVEAEETKGVKHGKLLNAEQLRDRIATVMRNMCVVETVDNYGIVDWENTFYAAEQFDADYMSSLFGKLKSIIEQHIFEQSVPATDIFPMDEWITNGEMQIPMSALEQALVLHDEIMDKYPDYLQQFYSTAARILNKNYRVPDWVINPDDIPF